METENNEDEMERVKVFFKALERRKMNGMSVRGCLWASQVEAVGKPSVYLILTLLLVPHPQPHRLQGEILSSFQTETPKRGKEKGRSQCVCTRSTQTGYSHLQS